MILDKGNPQHMAAHNYYIDNDVEAEYFSDFLDGWMACIAAQAAQQTQENSMLKATPEDMKIYREIADNYRSGKSVQPSQATGLIVWFGPMPESNGKSNWTAILHSGDLTIGYTLDRSEYKDRVRYSADSVRFLIGELTEEPDVLDYDGNLKEDCRVSQANQP